MKAHIGEHQWRVAVACALGLALLARPPWAWRRDRHGRYGRRPCPEATTKSGVATPGQPTVISGSGVIRQVRVMALKKLCRGQRMGRLVGFLAV